MKYKVKNNFVYGNKLEAKKDSIIELEGNEAAAIMKAGLIEPMIDDAKVEEPKAEAEEQKPLPKPEPKKGKNK